MKKLKKWFIRIIKILIILLFVYNLYNFICFRVLKYKVVPINGYALLEVVSGSMEPTINIGDLIVINIKEKKYKKNDIITFCDKEGNFVTHRIISISDKNITTKGDNNEVEDGVISTKNIVGKYVFKISRGGILLSSLRNPLVMIIIFVIGGTICFMMSTSITFSTVGKDSDYQTYLKNGHLLASNDVKYEEDKLKDIKIRKKKSNKKKRKKRAKRKKQSR